MSDQIQFYYRRYADRAPTTCIVCGKETECRIGYAPPGLVFERGACEECVEGARVALRFLVKLKGLLPKSSE